MFYIYRIVLEQRETGIKYYYIGQHKFVRSNFMQATANRQPITEEELLNDEYYGSGAELKRFRFENDIFGKKEILDWKIETKEEADRLETLRIAQCRFNYGCYSLGGYCLNSSSGKNCVYEKEAAEAGDPRKQTYLAQERARLEAAQKLEYLDKVSARELARKAFENAKKVSCKAKQLEALLDKTRQAELEIIQECINDHADYVAWRASCNEKWYHHFFFWL